MYQAPSGPIAMLVATGCAGIMAGRSQTSARSGGGVGQPARCFALLVGTNSLGSVATQFTQP